MEILEVQTGPFFGGHLGNQVGSAGDIDGDGFEDYFGIWEPYDIFGGVLPGGCSVFSGATGLLLYEFAGYARSAAAAGDVDGDGMGDLFVGEPFAFPAPSFNPGKVTLYSGATGGVLWETWGTTGRQAMGTFLLQHDDVNLDGINEVFCGSYGGSLGGIGGGIVPATGFLLSGADGSILWQATNDAVDWFGYSASSFDDVNGDGIREIQIAASGGGDQVSLHSGLDGQRISSISGPSGIAWGWSVATVDDMDGDDVSDLLVGAPLFSNTGGFHHGAAFLFSGASGAPLSQIIGSSPYQYFGYSLARLGDVDGDGEADLAIGESNGGTSSLPTVHLYSMSGGSLLRRVEGPIYDLFGSSVAALGDSDGDGLDEILVGSPYGPGGATEKGVIERIDLDPFLVPSSDELSIQAGVVQLDLDFPASEAGKSYILLASLAGIGPTSAVGVEVPLRRDALFNRIASGNAPPQLQGAYGSLDLNAHASASLTGDFSLSPYLGQTIHFAAVTFDTGPLTGRMSSAVRYVQIVQ
jgi:FG-GAP repeat